MPSLPARRTVLPREIEDLEVATRNETRIGAESVHRINRVHLLDRRTVHPAEREIVQHLPTRLAQSAIHLRAIARPWLASLQPGNAGDREGCVADRGIVGDGDGFREKNPAVEWGTAWTKERRLIAAGITCLSGRSPSISDLIKIVAVGRLVECTEWSNIEWIDN